MMKMLHQKFLKYFVEEIQTCKKSSYYWVNSLFCLLHKCTIRLECKPLKIGLYVMIPNEFANFNCQSISKLSNIEKIDLLVNSHKEEYMANYPHSVDWH